MSLGYSVSINLNIDFNKNNIEIFLKKGINKLDFTYYSVDYKRIDCLGAPITLNEALDIIIQNRSDENFIIVKYSNFHFFLHYINYGNSLGIMFSNFFNSILNEYENDENNIDIRRYISLMLALSEEVRIIELHAQKD